MEGVMIGKTKKTPVLANRLEKLCRACEPKSRNKINYRTKEAEWYFREKEKKRNEQSTNQPILRLPPDFGKGISARDIICCLSTPSIPVIIKAPNNER